MSQAVVESAVPAERAGGAAPARRWIISPTWDLLLLVAAPLAIVPLVSLSTARWVDVEQLALVVVSFASLGHHLPGFLRAYGDRELFARFRTRFLLAPPCVFLVALLAALFQLHGLALILLIWATWHGLMQTYGFMRIYDLKQGAGDRRSAQLDLALCLVIFVAGVVFSDGRVYGIADVVDKSGLPIPGRLWLDAARWTVGIVATVVFVCYALNVLGRMRRGAPLAWPRLALAFSTGWLYWLGGSLATDLLVGIATFEIFHAIQYSAIAWAYNRGRSRKAGALARPLGALFAQDRWASLGLYVALIAAFGAVRFLGEAGFDQRIQAALLALLTTSTFLHFYFDGFIWKVSERRTQQDLSIASEAIPARSLRSWRPGHATAWFALGLLVAGLLACEAFGLLGVSGAPERQLERLAALTPDLPELQWRVSGAALASGDTERALAAARAGSGLRPHAQQAHARLGAALLEAGQNEAAAAEFRAAAHLAPRRWQYLCSQGVALTRSHHWDEANEVLRRAASLEPQNAIVEAAWGNLCLERGDTRNAIRHDQAALALDPNDGVTRRELALMLSREGRHDEGLRLARSALELHPDEPDELLALAAAERAAGQPSEAVTSAERALARLAELTPADARRTAAAYAELALDQAAAGQTDAAGRTLELAVDADPTWHLAHFELGNWRLAGGDIDRALQAYRRAIDADERFAPAYANLASALLMSGNLISARKAYERSLELAPDNGEAHYNLGLLLMQSGDAAAARPHLLRAQALGIVLPPELSAQLNRGQ